MKDLFIRDKQLANHWRQVAHSPEFEKVLTFARSEIARQGPSRDELKGAELMAHTLATLSDAEEVSFSWPSPGLNHQADSPPPRPEEPPKRKKK